MGTSASKSEVSPQEAGFDRQVEEAKELLKQITRQPKTAEEVKTAARQVYKTVHNPTAVNAAANDICKLAVKLSDLKGAASAAAEGKARDF